MIILRVLNDCTIVTNVSRITPNAKVLFSLACYLIVERGKFIPRQVLTSLFWPNTPPRSARHSLRRALWQLRKDGFPLTSENELHVFLPKNAATLDVDLLDHESDTSLLHRSFDILPWFTPAGTSNFRDWVDDLRYLIRTRLTIRLLDAAARAKSRADWNTVVILSEQTLHLDSECEAARVNLTRARQFLRARYLPRSRSNLAQRHDLATPLHGLINESAPPGYSLSLDASHGFHEQESWSPTNDLSLLLSLLNQAIHQRGSAIHLWGDEHIGSSLLFQEFVTIAEARDTLLLTTTFAPTRTNTTYQAITPTVNSLLNAPGAAGCHPRYTACLTTLLSRSTPVPPLSEVLPAVADLVEAVADEQPLVLIFEHLHHADSTSLTLLDQLASKISTHAVLLIGTSATPNTSLPAWQRSRHLRTDERFWFPLANEAYNGVADTEAALTHRLQSGTLLSLLANAIGDVSQLRYAQNTLLPVCDSIISTLTSPTLTSTESPATPPNHSPTTHETIAALRFQMVSHTLIGDPTQARQSAHQLIAHARTALTHTDRYQTLLLCATCLHWCGTQDTPSSLYLRAFSDATRDKNSLFAMQAAQGITKLFLDQGNARAAETWASRMQKFIPATLSLWERHVLLLLQIQVALANNNPARADFLLQSSADVLNAPLLGVQATAKACQLRLSLLKGAPDATIKQQTTDLVALTNPLRALRVYHYEFYSLYLAFTHLGDHLRGIQILKEYLAGTQHEHRIAPPETYDTTQECNAR